VPGIDPAGPEVDEDCAVPGPDQETAQWELHPAVLIEHVLVAGPGVAGVAGPGEYLPGDLSAGAVVDRQDLD
jgi:hypothetical protein